MEALGRMGVEVYTLWVPITSKKHVMKPVEHFRELDVYQGALSLTILRQRQGNVSACGRVGVWAWECAWEAARHGGMGIDVDPYR